MGIRSAMGRVRRHWATWELLAILAMGFGCQILEVDSVLKLAGAFAIIQSVMCLRIASDIRASRAIPKAQTKRSGKRRK